MRSGVRVGGIVAAAGVGALGLSACGGGLSLGTNTLKDDATVAQKVSAVRLQDMGNGSVRVTGGSGGSGGEGATVHREIRYADGHKPGSATYRVEGGTLVLAGCGRDCSVDYTVRVPKGVPVSGGTSNGEVALSGVGAVRITTSNGGISLDGVSGGVDAKTSNGKITGSGLSGGPVQAQTSNGSIGLTLADPQNVRARTSNGAITVTAPGGPYAVTAETGGDKNIGVPNSASAQHTLDLHTSNGAITVKPAA